MAYRGNIKTIKLLPRFDGQFEQFDEGGKLWKKANFDRGEYHGIEEHYYRSGKVMMIRNYGHGRFSSIFSVFLQL